MELNKEYKITYDSENTILQHFTKRECFKREDKKRIKGTGEIKNFIDSYYYPNLKSALMGFLNKCTWDLQTAEEILEELKKLEIKINKLK